MANEINQVRERVQQYGDSGRLTDGELLQVVTGRQVEAESLQALSVAKLDELISQYAMTESQAMRLSAAFELGRRWAWQPPRKGERCLDPARVYELCRDAAAADVESFYVVLLDTRGRLIRRVQVGQGSVSQCPVSPRDCMRAAVREGAHGVVFVHNHPSGDPAPSPEDQDLTERLRAAAEIVGVVPRDHVIVGSGGYYSFVEAGRWRR